MVWDVEIIQKELDKAFKENSEIKFFFIFNQAVNEIKRLYTIKCGEKK